jgi:ribosomal protein L30E
MSKTTDNLTAEIKEGNVAYGSQVALKLAAKDAIEKVYIATDCQMDIEQALKEKKVNIIKLPITKEALRELCKKPFNISVLSIKKEGKKARKKEAKEK